MDLERHERIMNATPQTATSTPVNPKFVKYTKQLIETETTKNTDPVPLIDIEPTRNRFYDIYHSLSTVDDKRKCLTMLNLLLTNINK